MGARRRLPYSRLHGTLDVSMLRRLGRRLRGSLRSLGIEVCCARGGGRRRRRRLGLVVWVVGLWCVGFVGLGGGWRFGCGWFVSWAVGVF